MRRPRQVRSTARAAGAAAVAVVMSGAAWLAAGRVADAAGGLVTQRLPAGVEQLFGITCPSARVCYAAGGDQSTTAVIVTTTDAGATWHAQQLSGSLAFAEIACTDPTHCVAVGYGATQQSGAAFITTDGATWTAASVPVGTALLQAVTCVSANLCMAGGGSISGTAFITSTDGGATWSAATIPLQSGLTDLDCVDGAHCWAAGLNGLYFSSDFGVGWEQRGPTPAQLLPADCLVPLTPPPGGGTAFGAPDCIPFYDGVDFTDADHGWLVAEGKGLGRGPSVGTSRLFHTSDGGSSWQRWSPPSSFPLKSASPSREMVGLACAANACTGVAQVVDAVSGQGTSSELVVTADGQSWQTVARPSPILTGIACPSQAQCFASGYAGPSGVILGGFAVGAGPGAQVAVTIPGATAPGASTPANADQSALASSLLTPRAAFASPPTIVTNALLVLALVLLVVFPSQLFNHTFEENHQAIRSAWQRRMRWTARFQRAPRAKPRRGGGSLAAVVLLGALLASFLDPRAGLNLHTLALFLGVAASISFGVMLGGVVGAVYRRARHQPASWALRALPSGLVVAGACVLISRLTAFTPGYLYGIIGGVAFAGELNRRQSGQLVALGSLATLLVSVVAWLLWVPVDAAAARPGAGFGLALLENALAAVFVSGLVGTVIALVPLRFLPGEKLAGWHRGAWLAVFATAAFGLLQVMLRPQTSGAHVNSVAFWTTTALFVAFGAASLCFWGYFRLRRARGDR